MNRKRELRVTDYLQHILDAIERIESYLADSDEQTFAQSFMAQDAVIRNRVKSLAKRPSAFAPSTPLPQGSIPSGIKYAGCVIGWSTVTSTSI